MQSPEQYRAFKTIFPGQTQMEYDAKTHTIGWFLGTVSVPVQYREYPFLAQYYICVATGDIESGERTVLDTWPPVYVIKTTYLKNLAIVKNSTLERINESISDEKLRSLPVPEEFQDIDYRKWFKNKKGNLQDFWLKSFLDCPQVNERMNILLTKFKDFGKVKGIIRRKKGIKLKFRFGQWYNDEEKSSKFITYCHIFWFTKYIQDNLSQFKEDMRSDVKENRKENLKLLNKKHLKIVSWLNECSTKLLSPFYDEDNGYVPRFADEARKLREAYEFLPDETYAETTLKVESHDENSVVDENDEDDTSFNDQNVDISNLREILGYKPLKERPSVEYFKGKEQTNYFIEFLLKNEESSIYPKGYIASKTMKLYNSFPSYPSMSTSEKVVVNGFCGRFMQCIDTYDARDIDLLCTLQTEMVEYIENHLVTWDLFLFILDSYAKAIRNEVKSLLSPFGNIQKAKGFRIDPNGKIFLSLKTSNLDHVVSINLTLQPIYKMGKKRLYDLNCLLYISLLDPKERERRKQRKKPRNTH